MEPATANDPTCSQCLQVVPNLETNESMDDKLYCISCMDAFNKQRFARPDYNPDAPVKIEYQLVSDYSKKRKHDENIHHPLLDERQRQFESTSLTEEEKKTAGLSITELAYLPWPALVPSQLREKHPHPYDTLIRLDEENDRHDYYVTFHDLQEEQKQETGFLQSTSAMINQYFPTFECTLEEFLFGSNAPQLFAQIDPVFVQRAEDIKQRLVLDKKEEYEVLCFVDAVVKGSNWGPMKTQKYCEYYSPDDVKAIEGLKRMMVDWKQKNKDACRRGSFVHYLIECDMNGVLNLATHPIYSQPHLNHIQQYLTWKREHFDPFYVPWRTEMRFLSTSKYRRVGTGDLLAVEKNHPPPSLTGGVLRLVMYDWKNKIVKKKSFFDTKTRKFRKGIFPMQCVDDCSLRHGELQQADYEKMLVENYHNVVYNGHIYRDVKVTQRKLVCFDDLNANNIAQEEPLPNDYKSELEYIWKRRAEAVSEWEKKGRPLRTYERNKLDDQDMDIVLLHMLQKHKYIRAWKGEK